MADYTIVEATEVKDVTGGRPGEMRMMGNTLGSDQIALTYRRLPAGYKPAQGHTHTKIDEVVFVYKGKLELRLDDEIIEIGPLTAVRIGPNVKRGYHNNGTEDVEMVVASVQGDLVGDNGGTPDRNWWTD